MAGLISNGTYVLGANVGEVSTDGTLTGKGTPDSPLGVNEAVLWSGSANSCALSESYKNFARLKLEWEPWGSNASSRRWSEFSTLQDLYTLDGVWCTDAAKDSFIMVHTLSGNGTSLSYLKGAWSPFTSTTVTTAGAAFKLIQVVGINRTAGGN